MSLFSRLPFNAEGPWFYWINQDGDIVGIYIPLHEDPETEGTPGSIWVEDELHYIDNQTGKERSIQGVPVDVDGYPIKDMPGSCHPFDNELVYLDQHGEAYALKGNKCGDKVSYTHKSREAKKDLLEDDKPSVWTRFKNFFRNL